MKKELILLVLFYSAICLGQDRSLAPRGSLLTGSADEPSARGIYVITFPPPNECVDLGKIRASSRVEALYIAVSKGGFSLKPSNHSLSVWTIEEWDDFAKEAPDFLKEQEEHCKKDLLGEPKKYLK